MVAYWRKQAEALVVYDRIFDQYADLSDKTSEMFRKLKAEAKSYRRRGELEAADAGGNALTGLGPPVIDEDD